MTGPAQLEFLLDQMRDIPWHQRLARFVCVIALAVPGRETAFAEGKLPGVIEFAPRGSGGFGYDPLLYLLDEDMTVAELTLERKNEISHRAQAARAAREILVEWMQGAAR